MGSSVVLLAGLSMNGGVVQWCMDVVMLGWLDAWCLSLFIMCHNLYNKR